MSLAVSGVSRVLVIGDSLQLPFTAPSVPMLSGAGAFGALIRAQYAPSVVPAASSARWPIFHVDGQAGRAATTISGSIATILASWPKAITHILFQLGINDADNIRTATSTLNQCTTACQTLVTAAVAAVGGANVGWIGPWAHDSGDDLVQIGQIDAGYAPILAAAGGTYIKMSDVSNAGAAADGTHPTATATPLMGVRILTGMTLAA